MLTQREVLNAIAECEKNPRDYADCQKLATFYTILDHMTAEPTQTVTENVIGEYGDSEFLQSVAGLNSSAIWSVLDELASTVQVLNPNLYAGVMRKIRDLS